MLPDKRRDADWLSETASRLEQVPGVEQVEVSAVSGSLLIRHHAGAELKERLVESGLFRIIDRPFSSPPIIDRVTDSIDRSNRVLERRTGGRVNLQTLLILVLIGLAIVQTLRGRFMMPAVSLLLFAAQLVFMAKDSEQHPLS